MSEETDAIILDNIAIDIPDAAQVDHVDEISGAQGVDGGQNQTAALSLGLIRALQYAAQDYHSWRMLHEEDEITEMTSEEFNTMANQEKLVVVGMKLSTLHKNVRQAKKQHLSQEGEPARLGAQLVDKIVHASIQRRWTYLGVCYA